jgi:hypothetical protein
MKNEEDGRSLTLYEIERELMELLVAQEEPGTPEGSQQQLQSAILTYVAEEIRKVDGIRAYIRSAEVMVAAAKEEANRLTTRAHVWQNRIDRLKQFCLRVMVDSGQKCLEGRTGTLTVAGNGGLAPLIIGKDADVPEEFCDYTGTISGEVWMLLIGAYNVAMERDVQGFTSTIDDPGVRMERIPATDRIRERLKSGPVDWATLAERGIHLGVK